MNIDWPAVAILGTLVVSLLTAALTLYRTRPELRKVQADTNLADAQTGYAAAQSAELLLGPLNTRIDELQDQITGQARKISTLESERDELKQGRAKREEDHTAEIDSLKAAQAAQQEAHKGEIAALQNEVDGLRGGIMVLVAQLEAAHITPEWKPKPKPGTGPLAGG